MVVAIVFLENLTKGVTFDYVTVAPNSDKKNPFPSRKFREVPAARPAGMERFRGNSALIVRLHISRNRDDKNFCVPGTSRFLKRVTLGTRALRVILGKFPVSSEEYTISPSLRIPREHRAANLEIPV
jgi:hypothetical protein